MGLGDLLGEYFKLPHPHVPCLGITLYPLLQDIIYIHIAQ